MPIAQSHLMVVLQMIGLISKESLCSNSGFLKKFTKFPKARDDKVSNPK